MSTADEVLRSYRAKNDREKAEAKRKREASRAPAPRRQRPARLPVAGENDAKVERATEIVQGLLGDAVVVGMLIGGRKRFPPGWAELFRSLPDMPDGPAKALLWDLLMEYAWTPEWSAGTLTWHPPRRRQHGRTKGRTKDEQRNVCIVAAVEAAVNCGLPFTCEPTARRNSGVSACAVVASVLKELGVSTPRTATEVAAIARRSAL
jgi:hypothetical protein